jgi:hypothetical protein
MRKLTLIAPLLLALALSACAQDRAGLTVAEVSWCPGPDGQAIICGAKLTDGKERQDVELSVMLPDGGGVDYKARAVKAFDGQRIRAAVHAALIRELGQATPGLVDAIVAAVAGVP